MGEKNCINRGNTDSFYIRDSHPAIISRENFLKAQQIRAVSGKVKKREELFNPFRGKICCSCGRSYFLVKNKRPYWECTGRFDLKKPCNNGIFYYDEMEFAWEKFCDKLRSHADEILTSVLIQLELLEETVQELQGQHIDSKVETVVDINVTAFIPDEWVGSKEQKMIEYKRLADVKNDVELDYITEEWKDRFSVPPKSVDNLIKLIRIRLAASDVKISLIRETSDNIRIYTPYTQPEWKLIQPHLPAEILKRIKFTTAPASCTEGVSILLLNNSYMNFDEIFNILTDLFYYIYKVSHEY